MLKLLPQTTKGLAEEIQCIGCFFRSAQAMAEIEANQALTIDQINQMWLWAKSEGIIDENLKMKASAPIANHTLNVLGVKNKKFIEIATSKNGVPAYYKSIPKEKRKPDYFIRKIKNQYSGTHFLVVDEKGKTIFDPDNSAIDKGEIYTILYKIEHI